jgi:esterase/lipase superfamily enzyme
MKIEYHHWWSSHLNQEMELKVYGHDGQPIVVFPAMCGRFFEFEDFKMIDATWQFIEGGKVQFYTVDSIDSQSWANWEAHPADKARRHEDYDQYIIQEVVPFIQKRFTKPVKPFTTGVSMGGYHAGNFFFRHPDIFGGMISLSGLFQNKMFVGDYMDDNVYFNAPLYYLPNLIDHVVLDQMRAGEIIICTGQGPWEEDMVADAREMRSLLHKKAIPAWVDLWGFDVNHDWPWWRKQLPYFLGHLFG